MSYAEKFVADFSRCFSDVTWLPFISSPQYQVKSPNPRSRECSECGIFHFSFFFGDKKVGHLELVPEPSDQALMINRISSCYGNFRESVNPRQVGKELVRRSFQFALTNGFKKLTTSTMIAPTFFLGLGFRSERYNSSAKLVELLTARVPGQKKIKNEWLKAIEKDPDAIWEMARKKSGRAGLEKIYGRGVIDFSDEKQLNYVHRRLEL